MLGQIASIDCAADWWSLQPLAKSPPPALDGEAQGWARNEIDHFVWQCLAEAGLEPGPPADARTLARRLHFDLVGLPPSPQLIASFEAHPNDARYSFLIDELLASPQYGERWARHWLDVARYGESNGFEYNESRRNAWPYRDWVIDAINKDLPYNDFVRLQLAGDLLKPGKEGAAAVGFLVAGVHNTVLPANSTLKGQARADELEEMVGTVGQAFLGLTLNCARCHDHKVDPIPTEEYYKVASALSGVFHGTDKGLKMHTVIAKEPGGMKIHHRGSVADLGAVVAAGGVSALANPPADFGLAPDAPEAERRKKLAEWITHNENPLFARVAVNRAWAQHFGRGLVATPNDFGASGSRPSHPELLDWLANWFIDNGYSLKALHKLIVSSTTYRQSSAARATALESDAGSTLLWRYPPQRVSAEALRDSMLAVAGLLNLKAGGPGFEDTHEEHFNAGRYYHPIYPAGPDFDRRTVYRFAPRGGRPAILDAFDAPSPSASCPQRAVTTTPLQALSLRNNPFVRRCAESFASRLEGGTTSAKIKHAWNLALCRAPDAVELAAAAELAGDHGLASVCRALFNSGEFILIE